jgi:hypothetical protein
VAVDANSNAYVTGSFSNQISASTITLNSAGATDVFVAKYSNTGTLKWMVRTGATGQEYANGIKPDPFGNVYFTGKIAGNLCAIGSTTYASIGGSWDTYIAKLDSTGIFLWNYRIGSTGTETGYNIATSANGVFLASAAQTTLINVGTQTFTFSGNIDGMLITQFNTSGGVVNSYSLNGGGDDMMDLCLDNCALYVGGDLLTPSVNFGTIVVTHTAPEVPFVARLQLAVGEPTISISGNFSICAGASATLQANGANSYVWSNGAASNSIVVSPATTSVYIVTGSSSNLACAASKAQTVAVSPSPTLTVMSTATSICSGASVTLSASGANTYSWSSGAQTNSLVVNPSNTITFSVTGFIAACSDTKLLTVLVNQTPQLIVSAASTLICENAATTLSVSGADTYTWSNGFNLPAFLVAPQGPTLYTVIGTNTLGGCSATASIQLTVTKCSGITSSRSETTGFIVFPNPSSNCVNIFSDKENNLMLINVLGQNIMTLHIQANETIRLSLAAYGSGVYYLKSQTSNEVQKIIVESGR